MIRRGLVSSVLLGATLASSQAMATASAELYRTQAYFYGRFEARVQYAPGEGVVSSFFLWKDGSSSTTLWNELDYEKLNSDCRMQTNAWTGMGGVQHTQINTMPGNICTGYHTYSFEWTPTYIAWFVDGKEIRRETGAIASDYTANASTGMKIHFNVWPGDATFGGAFSPSILPVHEYISWVQYSSYTNGSFQLQWREEFDGSGVPSGWAEGDWGSPMNNSTHNPANVNYVNGIAVLSLTADGATGYKGTPPADTAGSGGTAGTGGSSSGTARGGATSGGSSSGTARGGATSGTARGGATSGTARGGAASGGTSSLGTTSGTTSVVTAAGGVNPSVGGAGVVAGGTTANIMSATNPTTVSTAGTVAYCGSTPCNTTAVATGQPTDDSGCGCRLSTEKTKNRGLQVGGLFALLLLTLRRGARKERPS